MKRALVMLTVSKHALVFKILLVGPSGRPRKKLFWTFDSSSVPTRLVMNDTATYLISNRKRMMAHSSPMI